MNVEMIVQDLIYKSYVNPYSGSSMLTNTEDKDVILRYAKSCALIAVESAEYLFKLQSSDCEIKGMKYYRELQQAIKNYTE